MVLSKVASFFWKGKRQIDKAKKWFENALKLEPSNGDILVAAIACETDSGDVLKGVKRLVEGLVSAEQCEGLRWNTVVKRVENWRLDWKGKLRAVLDEIHPEESSKIEI